MTAGVRKKIMLSVLGVLSLSLNCVITAANNNVVMKIQLNDNETASIQPRMMISQYNTEMKEKNKLNEEGTTDEIIIYDEDIDEQFDEKNNSENHINFDSNVQFRNFPHSLQIVSEILKNLKNVDCVRDTTSVLEGMTRHERWALELFDSFPKFPVGILYGNYYQLGNFDECVGVKHTLNSPEDVDRTIQGQYCLADINIKHKGGNSGRTARSLRNETTKPNRYKFNNTIIHWGICLPTSCTTEDAQVFVQEIFSSAIETFEATSVIVEKNKCYYENSPPFSTLEVVYGCIIGVFVIFTMLATGFHCIYLRQRRRYATYNIDSLRSESPKLLHHVIISFSSIHTIQKFLHTKPNELNLECICGIKFLSMALIIAGHSLIFAFGGPMVNMKFFEETSTKLENGPLLNNALLVDTFLLISGFLLCRLLLIELEKTKGKLNVLVLYVARYIRLTPSYIVVIGLYTTFLYRAGSGPLWNSRIGLEKERCLNSWWLNILYVNNYVNTDELCMFQSWYLAVDYHMFIISPLVIYPLWWRRRMGEYLLAICTLISIGIPFWITFRDNLDPTFLAYPPEVTDLSKNFYFVNVYMKTHMRSSSYFIGLLFGYLVHKLQSSGTKLKPYVVWLGWIFAAGLGIMSMYSIVIFYNPDHIENNFESAVYASLHRVAWCLAIGWVMVACITDNAAIVNKFLSCKPFIPASRLTYCAYLANGLIEVFNIGVLRQPMYMSKYELACKTLGHLLLTFAVAFVLCILFESPIHSLEKILLRKQKVKEQNLKSTLKPVEDS